MHVLGQMVAAVKPGGQVFDLQVIRPDPVVEVDLVCSGALIEEAIYDHDVREHYTDGADLVATWATKRRQLPRDELPALRALARPCAVRERCRLRRLHVR